jgi:hypothetical protein
MDPRFTEYGAAVCTYIRHATAKEKEAIRKELSDHMEDHAQALIDGGFPEDHAIQIALESMGEAETIGRELNKEYPRHWGVLVTVFQIMLLLLGTYLLIFSGIYLPNHLGQTLEARLNPMGGHSYIPTHAGDIYPLDIRQELPGGTILSLYGVARNEDGQVWIYTVSYPKNPFQNTINNSANLTFTYGNTDTGGFGWQDIDSSYVSTRACYYRYGLHEVMEGDILTAHYDHYGTTFDVTIPWEEASP